MRVHNAYTLRSGESENNFHYAFAVDSGHRIVLYYIILLVEHIVDFYSKMQAWRITGRGFQIHLIGDAQVVRVPWLFFVYRYVCRTVISLSHIDKRIVQCEHISLSVCILSAADIPLEIGGSATRMPWYIGYLSAIGYLFGCRKILCFSVSPHNDEALSEETLDKLFALGKLDGSILHSDQGVLYTSKKWRKRLKKNGVIQSMSRKGNCWDNACMEHFFGTLKVESGYDDLLKSGLLSYEETKKLIDNFIEYYNNERIQQNLGWKTPSEVAA